MSTVEEPQVRRTMLVALGSLAVLAVVWLLVLGPMLTGGEEEDFSVPRPDRTPELPGGDDETEDDEAALVPESYDVFAARDPFQQLVPERGSGAGSPLPPSTGGGFTGGGTSGGGTSGGGTSGDGTSDGGTSDGGASDGTSDDGTTDGSKAGSQTQVGETRVKLVDVYTDGEGRERVVVTVDGRTYEPAEGETFAQRFRLLDIAGECATFLYGDNRFVLCEGEEIRK